MAWSIHLRSSKKDLILSFDYNYTRNYYSNCIYYRKLPNDSYVSLLLYDDDDTLIEARDKSEINLLKVYLSGEFKMKNLGVAKRIFGWRSIDQKKKNEDKMVECFGMERYKPVNTSLSPNFRLSTSLSS